MNTEGQHNSFISSKPGNGVKFNYSVAIGFGEVSLLFPLVIYGFELFLRHITPEKFYVEACDDGADDVLIIDRVSTEVTLSGISWPG